MLWGFAAAALQVSRAGNHAAALSMMRRHSLPIARSPRISPMTMLVSSSSLISLHLESIGPFNIASRISSGSGDSMALTNSSLMNGDAPGAEKVFREDLDRNPRNPRSLFGLREALKAQGRGYDAQFVDKQFQSAWKSPTPLKAEDLI